MQYLRTQLGTQFNGSPSLDRLSAWLDSANPNYRGKHHRVHCWLIEFDEQGMPWREMGLDENEAVILAGPSKDDYGFWLDTNMCYSDFTGERISEEYFENLWALSGVVTP